MINIRHLSGALRHSIAGLRRACGEQAFKHELLVFVGVLALLACIRPGAVWTAALICGWLLVMVVELLNSAIEEAFDLASPEFNIHVKYGKDMASAAIFVALLLNAVLWGCMFWDTAV